MSLHASDPLIRLRDELNLSLTTHPDADLRFAFGFRTLPESILPERGEDPFDRRITWDAVGSMTNLQRRLSMERFESGERSLRQQQPEDASNFPVYRKRSRNLYGHLVYGIFGTKSDHSAAIAFKERATALERLSRRLAVDRGTRFEPMTGDCLGWFGLVCRLVYEHPEAFSFGLAFDSYCVGARDLLPRFDTWDVFEAATRGEIALPLGVYLMWPTREARIASIEAVDCLRARLEEREPPAPSGVAVVAPSDLPAGPLVTSGAITSSDSTIDQVASRVTPPSAKAIQCYRLFILRGDERTQAAIAKRVYGDAGRQSQVSRDLKRVGIWIEAGNILPDLEEEKPKTYTTDPSKLDKGPGQSGRKRTR